MIAVDTDDNLVIDDILKGDKQKYAALIRKYNQRLYRISKGYLTDEAEIEDVMQEAYVKAYQNLERFEKKSQFSTWLTRILINECLQRLKKMKRLTLLNDNEEFATMRITDSSNPETRSLNKELKEILEHNIGLLPEKYKMVFIMREVERMNMEETSEALQISIPNVKVRLNRAKEMLRSSILKTYPVHEVFDFNLIRCDRIVENVFARI